MLVINVAESKGGYKNLTQTLPVRTFKIKRSKKRQKCIWVLFYGNRNVRSRQTTLNTIVILKAKVP